MEIDQKIKDTLLKAAKPAVKDTPSFEKTEKVIAAEREPRIDSLGRAYGSGGRKSASARVWIKPGKGSIIINKKEISLYFKRPVLRMLLAQPFDVTQTLSQFDVYATVKGSGLSGQAGAIRHAISNALSAYNPRLYHALLRKAGFITRDHREVERKKPGQKKARKKFQFSKR